VDAELRVDVLEVLPYRRRRDPELLGDLHVCLALRDEVQDLSLTPRKPGYPPPLFEEEGGVADPVGWYGELREELTREG
jgi:hypothetical protein